MTTGIATLGLDQRGSSFVQAIVLTVGLALGSVTAIRGFSGKVQGKMNGGKLGIQGPGQSDLDAFPQLYATYANVVVSRESDENAKRPADVVLSGKLPSGR